MTKMWFGDGAAISWERVGCVPISARSEGREMFSSNEVSLAHMLISSFSPMFRFFKAHELSSGGRPVER